VRHRHREDDDRVGTLGLDEPFEVPLPADEKLSLPGCRLARSINSCSELVGSLVLARSTNGIVANGAIAVKSRTGS